MKPLTLKLKNSELAAIVEYVKYEEPRVIKRSNILNCLHHGYTSSHISLILNVDQKTVINIGNIYLEIGFEVALYDNERYGQNGNGNSRQHHVPSYAPPMPQQRFLSSNLSYNT